MDKQTDGIRMDHEYYPPGGEEGHCPPDPHHFFQRYLKRQAITPAKELDTIPVRTTRHTYCKISTATGVPADWFVLAQRSQAFEDGQCVCRIDWSYVCQPDERDYGLKNIARNANDALIAALEAAAEPKLIVRVCKTLPELPMEHYPNLCVVFRNDEFLKTYDHTRNMSHIIK